MCSKKISGQELIKKLKEDFPNGCRVRFVTMDDPYVDIPEGTQGTVTGVDDIGTIHVHWDTGHHLGIAYGEDECRKVDD